MGGLNKHLKILSYQKYKVPQADCSAVVTHFIGWDYKDWFVLKGIMSHGKLRSSWVRTNSVTVDLQDCKYHLKQKQSTDLLVNSKIYCELVVYHEVTIIGHVVAYIETNASLCFSLQDNGSERTEGNRYTDTFRSCLPLCINSINFSPKCSAKWGWHFPFRKVTI